MFLSFHQAFYSKFKYIKNKKGAPAKHGPIMALTRTMAAKLAAQAAAEDTPKKISKPCETTPSSWKPCETTPSSWKPCETTPSSWKPCETTPSSWKPCETTPSSWKLPTPRTSSSYCEGCRKSGTLNLNSSTVSNYSFNFSEFATLINVQFRELSFKIERIINSISSIEESVTDHGAIINDVDRGISLIANRLDKISYHNDKVHKFTQTNHNSCSSLPLTKTPCSLNTQFRTTPTVSHAFRSAVSHSSVTPKSVPRSHPPRAVTHRQSSHTSRSTIPAPTSTLPRPIAPLVPSSPRQYPSPNLP